MATLGKIRSIDEYKKELGTPNVDAANKNIEQKRAADENTIIDYNSTIDDAAQATTSQYQKSIDDAPRLFEDQYDANHINELVTKKKIEERMANLGLAGSGLNRSQQTALAVQRGNADAATQRQQQDYVTAAQQAIDQVLAQAEADKATHANQLRGNTDTWAADLLARMAQADNENVVNAYNTGVEGVYSAYETDSKKETEIEKLLHEARENALDREAENLRSLRSLGLTLDADNHIVPLPMSAYDQAKLDSDNYLGMIKAGYVPDGNGGWMKDTSGDNLNLLEWQYSMVETLVKEGMPYEDAYLAVFGNSGEVLGEKKEDETVVQETTVPETKDVISGGYNTIGSWAQHNISKGIKNGTISKDSAAKMLYAQVLDTYRVEPHKKLTLQEQLKQTPEDIQRGESALAALWSTAYDLDIEDEMAELCEVSLGDVPAKYTGGRKKTTSSGTASSKGATSSGTVSSKKTTSSGTVSSKKTTSSGTVSSKGTSPLVSNKKDDGGLFGWLKGFISDYNTQ